MKWLRQHKWTLIISVLLFLGITNCQNLDQSKHSLSYSSYQIPSDKIDTPIRKSSNMGTGYEKSPHFAGIEKIL